MDCGAGTSTSARDIERSHMLAKRLTRFDVRAKRFALDTAMAALDSIFDELDHELAELQKQCVHSDAEIISESGAIRRLCEDCGLEWKSRR